MKKILVMLLALTLLSVLAGCNKEQGGVIIPTTAPATGDSHTHSYSSTEKTATCTEKGLETFSCACGHTYTEEIPATGHVWGMWEIETPALLGKDGVEKQTCENCGQADRRATSQDAVQNSFADPGLQYVFDRWNGVNGNITAYGMLSYFSQKYEGREEDPLVVSSEDMFRWLSQRFVLTEELKAQMKQTEDAGLRYDATTDTFELDYAGSYGDIRLMGYIHNGENKYTLYYEFASWNGASRADGVWEIAVEYNLQNGQPNKYLSATMVNSIPDKVVS